MKAKRLDVFSHRNRSAGRRPVDYVGIFQLSEAILNCLEAAEKVAEADKPAMSNVTDLIYAHLLLPAVTCEN